MAKQIVVFLNSPHIQSVTVDVADSTELSTWIVETKAKDFFISSDKQLWLYSAISGAKMTEAVSGLTAAQAMQAMESNARKR
jgi:hypothetical protein